jgi:hypothetical protein
MLNKNIFINKIPKNMFHHFVKSAIIFCALSSLFACQNLKNPSLIKDKKEESKETELNTPPLQAPQESFKPVEDEQQANEINAAKFITGSILLMVCDAIIPTATIKVLGMFDAKYKQLKTKNIKLSQEQKKDLEPLADECVKAMTLTMQPTTAFFLTMFILYGSNIMNTEI